MIRDALGLSKEAIERRRGYVMAGDAKKIMEGEWNHLWRVKRGLAEEEDIGDKLLVNMGSYTEPFNLSYCEEQTGRKVEYYTDNPHCMLSWHALHVRNPASDAFVHFDEFVVCEKHPHIAAHLDGMWDSPKFNKPGVIDAKHVGQFRYDEMVERYTWAMTHQAIVMDVDCWALSVFVGNGRWELIEQEVDVFAREELIEREADFWRFVQTDTEPPETKPVVAPPKPQPQRSLVNLNGGTWAADGQTLIADPKWPNWAPEMIDHFGVFERTHAAAAAHAISRDAIKKLMPADVGWIGRGNVEAKQDGRGVTIALKDGKDGKTS